MCDPCSHRLDPHSSRGRRNRDRTCDLCLVRAALYQLSYPPDFLSKLADATKSISPCQPNLALFLQILRLFFSSLVKGFHLATGLPGEERRVHLSQPFAFDMGVNLCRRNVGMSKHRLHRSKIGTSSQEMRGERMPQHVGGNGFRQSCAPRPQAQQFPKCLSGERDSTS